MLKGIDQDRDPLTFDLVSEPQKGRITEFDRKSGGVTYVPDPDTSGSDGFTFKLVDANIDRIIQRTEMA